MSAGRSSSRLADGRPASAARVPWHGDGGSWATDSAVRGRMQRQRTRDTAPELALRRLLHRMGLRYRVDRAPLAGLRRRADLVFPASRVAVFVDGCFWHGCPEHGNRRPSTNDWYWPAKIERNRTRDADTDERLRAAGWEPIRVWEHEDAAEASARVAEAVRRRRGQRL